MEFDRPLFIRPTNQMRALTIVPGKADSLELTEVDVPQLSVRSVLARTLAIGICGTDHEIECTVASALIAAAMDMTSPGGILCLAGLSSGEHRIELGAHLLGRTMALENDVVFGTVNAKRRHYNAAAAALVEADGDWLQSLITRRVPLTQWTTAFARQDGDVKTVIDFTLQ